ncbi:hypothetical protein QSK63_003825 [Escherichia coli]|nr:hypothetical protein [Escherichia coli]
MTEILRIAQTYEPWLDFWELVVQNVSTIASHTATNRPLPEAIMATTNWMNNYWKGAGPRLLFLMTFSLPVVILKR